MDSSRSSTSTLTMKESSSRPNSSPDLAGFKAARQQHDYRRRRRRSSYMSSIYKTQIYAGLRQNSANSRRSLLSTCLLLCPAFAFQFCIGLTSVFSIVNLHLLEIPNSVSSTHLILAASLSIGLTIVFKKCVHKLFELQKYLATLLICFTAYLSLGTLLVMAANVERMLNYDAHNSTDNLTTATPPSDLSNQQPTIETSYFSNDSYQFESLTVSAKIDSLDKLYNVSDVYKHPLLSNISKSSWQRVAATTPVPLYSKVMAFVGYIIMTSSLSCSHYLLCCVATSITHVDQHNRINIIETTSAAIGGCVMSFLGAVDLSWHPSKESTQLMNGNIVILLCITVILLVGCTTISIITWFSDVIIEKFRPIRKMEEHILIGRDRRPTRTAQEIFDECAALLGHQEQVLYTEEYLYQRNLAAESDEGISNSITQSETAMDDSILPSQDDATTPYIFQLPVPVRDQPRSKSWLVFLKTQKTFLQALLLIFLVSGCLVSVEYNSSVYLSHVTRDNGDLSENTYRKGVRTSSAGTFMTYLVSIVAFFFNESFLPRLGWKPLALGACLISSLLTLALAITSEVPVYFALVCGLGLMRVVVVRLPRLLTVQSQIGFQTSTVRQILIESPSTAAWCMTPLSLCLVSAVTSPLTDAPGLPEVSVYCSTVCAFLACVIVSTLL